MSGNDDQPIQPKPMYTTTARSHQTETDADAPPAKTLVADFSALAGPESERSLSSTGHGWNDSPESDHSL